MSHYYLKFLNKKLLYLIFKLSVNNSMWVLSNQSLILIHQWLSLLIILINLLCLLLLYRSSTILKTLTSLIHIISRFAHQTNLSFSPLTIQAPFGQSLLPTFVTITSIKLITKLTSSTFWLLILNSRQTILPWF